MEKENKKTFEEYLEKIEPDIQFKAFKRAAGDKDKYDDIYQRLQIHLWEKFPTFDENKASFRTWANRVMENFLKDLGKTKKEKIKDKDGLSVDAVIRATQLGSTTDDEGEEINIYENLSKKKILDRPTQFAENLIKGFDVQSAVKKAKIPRKERKLLELVSDGYSIREIADRINEPKTTTHRRFKKMKTKLLTLNVK